MPKIDLSKTYYLLFSATTTPADQIPVPPMENTNSPVQIKVQRGDSIFGVFNIDLENPLSVIKYKIFTQCGMHPNNQIIKFGGNPLTNESELLSACGVQEESIL